MMLRSAIHRAPAALPPPAGLLAAPAGPVVVVPPQPGGLPSRPSSPGLGPTGWAILVGFLYAGVVGAGVWLYVKYLDSTKDDRRDARRERDRWRAAFRRIDKKRRNRVRAGGYVETRRGTVLQPTRTRRETDRTRGLRAFEEMLDKLTPRTVRISKSAQRENIEAATSRGYRYTGDESNKGGDFFVYEKEGKKSGDSPIKWHMNDDDDTWVKMRGQRAYPASAF